MPSRSARRSPMGGLCLMVGALAAVGVGWTAACVAQPELLGAESLLSARLLIALLGRFAFGAWASRTIWPASAAVRRWACAVTAPCAGSGLRRAGAGPAGAERLPARRADPAGSRLCGIGPLAPLLWAGAAGGAGRERPAWPTAWTARSAAAAFVAMLGLMMLETLLGWFPLAVSRRHWPVP